MEMKNNKWMMAFLLGGALLLTVGCEKEKSWEKGGIPGSPIVFSAATSYINGEETRTVYSGDVYGTTNKIERIDWVPNEDKIQVNYKHGSITESADFSITSKTTGTGDDAYKSMAGVDGNVLQWADGTDHTFYAMYPTRDINADASLTNSNHFQGTLKPRQDPLPEMKPVTVEGKTWQRYMPDMKYAYMVAYAGAKYGISESDKSVILPFRPAVTTFEFRLRGRAGEEAMKVTKAEIISNQALTGTFGFDITGGTERGATWAEPAPLTPTSENRVITVNFPGEGAILPVADETSVSYLDFTVFALPVKLTQLEIILYFKEGKTRGLKFYDKKNESGVITKWHEFPAANKYVITNSSVPGATEWTYEVEEIPDIYAPGHEAWETGLSYTVKSYKYNNHNKDVKYPVKWKLQYTTAESPTELNWIDVPANGYATTDFWMGTLKGDGGTVGEGTADNAKLYHTSSSTTTGDVAAAALRAKLASAAPRGTASAPFDLSMHPSFGDMDGAMKGGQQTANCYVISAPGVYMFPCVYGNAIAQGAANVSAYAPSQSDAAVVGDANAAQLKDVYTYFSHNDDPLYYTPVFYNAANRPITEPWIIPDLNKVGTVSDPNAVVVWQDTPEGGEIIPYADGNVEVISVGGKDYIKFSIDKDHIKPGNLMIALRGGVSGVFSESDNILWSWHIWVTATPLAPTASVENTVGTYPMMPINLGWSDTDNGSVTKYADRELKFRVIQYQEADGTPVPAEKADKEEFLFQQIGDAITTPPSIGGNSYYQWGRKDPFLPSNPDGTAHAVSANPNLHKQFDPDGSIAGTNVGVTGLDYSLGIRLPYEPYFSYDNAAGYGSTGWIQGPVYPFSKTASGTSEYIWTIVTGHEKYGPFTTAQKDALTGTTFNPSGTTWTGTTTTSYTTKSNSVDQPWFWSDDLCLLGNCGHSGHEGIVLIPMSAWNVGATYGNDWTIKAGVTITSEIYNEIQNRVNAGYITAAVWDAFKLNCLTTNTTTTEPYYLELNGNPYPYGPHAQAVADIIVLNPISNPYGIFYYESGNPASDIEATLVVSPGAPYTAAEREMAACPSNLWNSYVYDEMVTNPANKFKTVYDPCPPGFTVPGKEAYIADAFASTRDEVHPTYCKYTDAVFVGLGASLVGTGLKVGEVLFPYTGGRIFKPFNLVPESQGAAGMYWTDSPFRLDWQDPATQDPTSIAAVGFYHSAYALLFGTDVELDNHHYVNHSYRVQTYTRGTALSIRPIADPKY